MPALFAGDRNGFVERWLLAEYLGQPAKLPDALRGDPRMGRRTFIGLGCATCHFLPDTARTGQPDLDRIPFVQTPLLDGAVARLECRDQLLRGLLRVFGPRRVLGVVDLDTAASARDHSGRPAPQPGRVLPAFHPVDDADCGPVSGETVRLGDDLARCSGVSHRSDGNAQTRSNCSRRSEWRTQVITETLSVPRMSAPWLKH